MGSSSLGEPPAGAPAAGEASAACQPLRPGYRVGRGSLSRGQLARDDEERLVLVAMYVQRRATAPRREMFNQAIRPPVSSPEALMVTNEPRKPQRLALTGVSWDRDRGRRCRHSACGDPRGRRLKLAVPSRDT